MAENLSDVFSAATASLNEGERLSISNVETVDDSLDGGKEKTVPKRMMKLIREFNERCDAAGVNLITLDGELFQDLGPDADPEERLIPLPNVDAFCGRVKGLLGSATFAKGPTAISRSEFFHEVKHATIARKRSFTEQTDAPTFPPIPGVFYTHKEIGLGDGSALDGYLGFFNFETPADRQLAKAMLVTLFRSQCGSSPGFFAAGDGRGTGKSKIIEFFAPIAGGIQMLDLSNVERMKSGLVTGDRARILFLDNSTSTIGDPALAALMTAPEIRAHQLYRGQKLRKLPVHFMFNGNQPLMDYDIAARTLVVKMQSCVTAGVTRDLRWDDRVQEYVRTNKYAIWADVRAFLEAEPPANVDQELLTEIYRSGEYALHVLAKLDDLPGVHRAIIEHREETNAEAQTIVDFRTRLFDYLIATEVLDAAGKAIVDCSAVFVPCQILGKILRKVEEPGACFDLEDGYKPHHVSITLRGWLHTREFPELAKTNERFRCPALDGERCRGFLWIPTGCKRKNVTRSSTYVVEKHYSPHQLLSTFSSVEA